MTRSSNYNNHQLSAVSLANSLTTIKHTEDNEMVFNATFNNIIVIMWSVLLVGGNRRTQRKPQT